MNDRKRSRIGAIIILLSELLAEERQDLKDTPDNIEDSAASDDFRANIVLLDTSILDLKAIK